MATIQGDGRYPDWLDLGKKSCCPDSKDSVAQLESEFHIMDEEEEEEEELINSIKCVVGAVWNENINPLSRQEPQSSLASLIDTAYHIGKKIFYEASVRYTFMKTKKDGDHDYDEIIDNFYLGMQPWKSHFDELKEKKIDVVVALLEEHELQSITEILKPIFSNIDAPMKKEEWEQAGVQYIRIPAADCQPLTKEQIEEGVIAVITHYNRMKKVYVHCKAGKGRSAMIAIISLMILKNIGYHEAFEMVTKKRPQVNMNCRQQKAITDYDPYIGPMRDQLSNIMTDVKT